MYEPLDGSFDPMDDEYRTDAAYIGTALHRAADLMYVDTRPFMLSRMQTSPPRGPVKFYANHEQD